MAPPVAMQGTKGNIQNTMGMGSAHKRSGAANTGNAQAKQFSAIELNEHMHYPEPSGQDLGGPQDTRWMANQEQMQNLRNEAGLPAWIGQYDGAAVPYAAASPQKEQLALQAAYRDAANKEIQSSTPDNKSPGVIRTAPITDAEINYVKQVKDQAELARFDQYVESMINPRQPGNMKWLMEVYPDYVERRLQQAHTDYEYALRNQMIDQWGINTFQDLYFKYMVDQGKIGGPYLARDGTQTLLDDQYTPGVFSIFSFPGKKNQLEQNMGLPFNSAKYGRRPAPGKPWVVPRNHFRTGNDLQSIARGTLGIGAATGAEGDAFMPTQGAESGSSMSTPFRFNA